MFVWIIFYYLVPALLCSAVSYLAYFLFKKRRHARWLMTVLLTLSWTPVIIAAGHGVGLAQLPLALAFYRSGWLSRTPLWTYGLGGLIAFVVVRRFTFKKNGRRDGERGQQ
jgi:hypothetical protein